MGAIYVYLNSTFPLFKFNRYKCNLFYIGILCLIHKQDASRMNFCK